MKKTTGISAGTKKLKSHKVMSVILKGFIASFCLVQFVFAGAPSAKAPAKTPELLALGKTSFTTNCVSCHGEKGDGNGPAGQYLNPKPRNYAKDKFKKGDKVEQIFDTVSKGIPGTSMVAYGHLPEQERWALAYYVKSLQGK